MRFGSNLKLLGFLYQVFCISLHSPPCSPCPLTHSLPLGNVDSFAPAHLTPEGLPLALSRAATLAAWVPFGPTFGCSISKAPPFRLWSIPLVWVKF